MNTEVDIAFELLRCALWGADEYSAAQSLCHSATLSLSTHHWWHLFRLMQQNHVAAMTVDTVATLDVPREVKIPWLAERDKAERWYRYQKEVQQEIIDTMKHHGIETLVLKGTHTAQYYPIPELREFGDLDLYFYDKHDEADRLARQVLKVSVSNDAHHHSKYDYRGITIESHYDFLNTHYPPSNRRYEALLKELVDSDKQLSTFNFQLSTFEVLFLLRHMAGHFAASRLTLRDLIDWMLTCQALHDSVDWGRVQDISTEFGMTGFVSAINDIIEQRFGISIPLRFTHDTDIANKVEHDIVYGNVDICSVDGVQRLLWKLRRWNVLAWKRQLVYSDSPLSLMLASLSSHVEKPRSILHKM